MANWVTSSFLAARVASRRAGVASSRAAAARWSASAAAQAVAAARSRSPGVFGDSSSTAAVLTTAASHQPASRDGMVPIALGVATGST